MTTDTNQKSNTSTTPTAPSITTRTPLSSSSGQRNRAQFKGAKNESRSQAGNRRGAGRGSRFQKRKATPSGKKPGTTAGKSTVRQAPTFLYLSVCCSAPARKPQTGRKDRVQDPESKKTKEQAKGLGKWHCSQCSKVCKVTVSRAVLTGATAVDIPVVAAPEAVSTTTQTATAGTEVTNEVLPV